MKILSLISKLIDYPSESIFEHNDEIINLIEQDTCLRQADKKNLLKFVNERLNQSLLDWQADYDGLFDRGRSLSLLIYEHIHGESRDRGQAMVDLLAQYKAAGLNISVRELPDYIPLFLEFVSTQGQQNAEAWLQDVAHVFALLTVRLEKRNNNYSLLFETLVNLSEAKIDLDSLREQVRDEKRDDTNKALDKVWEEEAITFGADAMNGSCPSNTLKPSEGQRRDQEVPISFINAAENASCNSLRS